MAATCWFSELRVIVKKGSNSNLCHDRGWSSRQSSFPIPTTELTMLPSGKRIYVSQCFSTVAFRHHHNLGCLSCVQKQQALIPARSTPRFAKSFTKKGFEGELLDRVVEVITGNRKLWIETMLKEEWWLSLAEVSPTRAAAVTFFAFIIVGMMPLLPFLVFDDGSLPFTFSIGMTAAVFFGIGALKSRYVAESWIRAGLETLLMGGGAATLAYVVGVLLRGLADSSPGFVR
jgi:hypothetical protein